jgi:hypothetical protein
MSSLATIKGGGAFSRQNIRNINANFTALNGSAIVGTLTSAHLLIGNGSNVATDTAVTGDVTITNAGVTAIKTSVSLTTPVLGAATGTSLVLSGDCTAATYHAGATAGVTAGPFTTVSSIRTVAGIVTVLTGT